MNTKRDLLHLKETESYKVSTTEKFTDLKKEQSVLKALSEDNGSRLDTIDELLLRFANSIKTAEQFTANQMATDSSQEYKIMMIKRDVHETS